ncbi:MAG: hypothetical protein ACKVS9_03685 [Phycisphaerae bacterium]
MATIGPRRANCFERQLFTDIIEPNVVDCVQPIGRGFPGDSAAEAEIRADLPFLEIALVRRKRFDRLVNFFATDRFEAPNGTVEVIR